MARSYTNAKAAVAGSGGIGDVVGPASSTDNAIARWDSTTGKLLQNSAAFVDDNGNVYAPNLAPGLVSIATAAATTTLTITSKGVQVFTGVTTQTVVLPVVTTLPQIGFQFLIVNNSSGTVTVNSSGANLVQTIVGGGRALITCVLLTGATAASWTSNYNSGIVGITNSAPANTIPKSDGTNLVVGLATDDGSAFEVQATGGIILNGGTQSAARLVAGANGIQVAGSGSDDAVFIDAPTIILTAASGVQLASAIIKVGALPTSDPSIDGNLWSNLGVVMRSNG